MDKSEFINKIRSSSDRFSLQEIQQYFKDYEGPFSDAAASEYIRYFSNAPEELSRNAEQGTSHRESLMENGMLKRNSPF